MVSKVPIYAGIFFTKPTMLNTAIWQFVNQSYMAGLTYSNRNQSCHYTNQDLAQGYSAAIVSSIGIGLTMRKLTSGMMKGSTGNKYLAINLLVNASAASSANIANTMLMRHAEIERGISVFADPELENEIGVSKDCAKQALALTSVTRGALATVCMAVPISLLMMMNVFKLKPKGKNSLIMSEVTALAIGLYIGLPISLAMYPSIIRVDGD